MLTRKAIVDRAIAFQNPDRVPIWVDGAKIRNIEYDAEKGVGTVEGGSLTAKEDGLFVYKDAKQGLWLIEKK